MAVPQTLTANKPAPAGVGAQGLAVASDGSVALLSGSRPMGSQPASAYLFSFYPNVGQYNFCPQEIDVRASRPMAATEHMSMDLQYHEGALRPGL